MAGRRTKGAYRMTWVGGPDERPLPERNRSRHMSKPGFVIGLLVAACIAAGCSGDGVQTVATDGAPARPAEVAPAPSTTTTATTAVPVPAPPVTIPALPLPTITIPPRPTTTTTRPRPTTTRPPVSAVRRPAAYAAGQSKPNGPGVVVPISALGTAGTPIPIPGIASAMAVTADGATLLVVAGGSVTVIDTATSTRRYEVVICPSASGLAVTPDGNSAWVTCDQQGTVVPVDLLRRQALDPIPVGYGPVNVVITPDGKTAYVVNYNGTSPSDPEPTVVPVAIATRTAGPPIRLGYREAAAMALTRDGRTLYAVTGNGCCASSVVRIDTATNKVSKEFPTRCTGARGIALTEDGNTGYFGCFNGITTVTLDHFTESEPRPPSMIRGVALAADGRTLYAADWSGDLVEINDAATMQHCAYIELQNAAAVVVVPGIIPDSTCVKAAR